MTWTQERREALIAEVERLPRHIGRAEYLTYLRGEYLSPKRRILAECYRCNNGYVDGALDCENPECPLYGIMPYKHRMGSDDARCRP